MVHDEVELASDSFWWVNSLGKLPDDSESLGIDPRPLIFGNEEAAPFFSILNSVEIVHDDSYEKVQDKLASEHHEDGEVDDHVKIMVFLGLHANSDSIYTIIHDVDPTFCTHHFK